MKNFHMAATMICLITACIVIGDAVFDGGGLNWDEEMSDIAAGLLLIGMSLFNYSIYQKKKSQETH